jgi:hypothetical protein
MEQHLKIELERAASAPFDDIVIRCPRCPRAKLLLSDVQVFMNSNRAKYGHLLDQLAAVNLKRALLSRVDVKRERLVTCVGE